MNTQPTSLTTHTICWLAALALALLLSASWLLDGPSELQAAQDVADETEYAAALADGGTVLCARFGRIPKWTPEGHLVCRSPGAPGTALAIAKTPAPLP